MPLSEHEQRMLEQMERALYAEDPKLATALEGTNLRTHTRRRLLLGITGFVAGVVVLMVGMMSQLIVVGVIGFLIMLGGVLLAVTGWRKPGTAVPDDAASLGASRAPRTPRRGKVMNRFEERWNRRRDDFNN